MARAPGDVGEATELLAASTAIWFASIIRSPCFISIAILGLVIARAVNVFT